MLKRLVYAITVALVVALAVWVAFFAGTAGMFRDLEPVSPGECNEIAGFVGPEDIALDRQRGHAFVTSADRFGVFNEQRPPNGDIMLMDLSGGLPEPRSLAPMPPEDFFPHGLDLWIGPEGERRLFVVNHGRTGHDHSVEIFRVAADGALTHMETIRSDLFIDPNDVAAMGPRSFYATNLYGSESRPGRMLENYLMVPRANVVFFDGAQMREVVSGLQVANGIIADASKERIFVAEIIGKSVTAYDRAPDGALERRWRLDLPMAPDNLTLGPDGAIWAAGHPLLLEISRRMVDAGRLSSSEVIRIRWKGREEPIYETVYLDRGDGISAASVAAVHEDDLYIGSVFAPHILRCRLGGEG